MMDRPLLIAECCQNHGGDRATLGRMVDEAAAAGADLVKIQAIRSVDLVRRERFEEDAVDAEGERIAILRPYEAERQRLAGLDLTEDDEQYFVERCLAAGVAPMITLFTRFVADHYRAMGFTWAKIASYDCRSVPLLREVAASFPDVVVSTGATFDEEIEQAVGVFAPGQLSLLHAVTIYPTGLEDLHLARMEWLRTLCPQVGFSDHTAPAPTGLRASKLALALGADLVERHFTVLPPDATRDGPVSIDPTGLAELRRFADLPREEQMAELTEEWPGWEQGLGQQRRALTQVELANRDYYSGRFAARVGERIVDNWVEEPAAS
jgi:N,N'-diacetyllegionaminate synthase